MADDEPPPRWPAIRPTWRSLRLAPGDPEPPAFEIAPGGATVLWLEVATDAGLRRDLVRSDEVRARAVGAGGDELFPVTLTLAREAWDRVRDQREVVRLYYRVGGRDETGAALHSSAGDDERPHPFVHVGHSGIAADYEPADLASLPALRVRNERLEQVGGKETVPLFLSGVNVPGMDTRKYNWGKPVEKSTNPADRIVSSQLWSEAAGITKELFTWIRREWKANVVRIPLNQDWLLQGTKIFQDEPRRCNTDPATVKTALSATEYLRDVDRVVQWALGAGLYVMLTIAASRLHEEFDGNDNYSPRIYQAPLPDGMTKLAWRVLVSRYGRADGVLFDLFNEPHGVRHGDPDAKFYKGPPPPRPGTPDPLDDPAVRAWWEGAWRGSARDLADVVARSAPDKVVLIAGLGGPNWGASLRALPRVSFWPLANVLYTAHLYCNDSIDDKWADPGVTAAKGGGDPWKKAADANPEYWLATRETAGPPDAPIFVGEWGPTRWPWVSTEADPTWPLSIWAWANPTSPTGQKARNESLRDRLRPVPLGGSAGKVASPKLIGWAAWALNGHPRLNRGRKVAVDADQPRKKSAGKCQRLGDIPLNEINPAKPAELPLTPWGDMVWTELRAHPPGPKP